LEGVFSIRCVPEDAVADGQHHRTVPPNQRCECHFIPPGEELLQELSVSFALGMVDRDRLQQQTDPIRGSVGRHGSPSNADGSI
jgi:hypothetical protein